MTEHLLFLHGAVGAKDQLQPLADSLANDFEVHLLNFSGHGGEGSTEVFSIQLFAGEVLEWLREREMGSSNIFGYSMGGYVAMYLAANYPGTVNKLITLGTKYEWSENIATKEFAMLNPELIEAKVPKFAAQLQRRHSPLDWKAVLAKTANLLLAIGKQPPLQTEDYFRIKNEVLLLVGNKDLTVTLKETATVFRQLANAQLAVLPNTPHPVEAVDEQYLSFLVRKFLQ